MSESSVCLPNNTKTTPPIFLIAYDKIYEVARVSEPANDFELSKILKSAPIEIPPIKGLTKSSSIK